MPMAVKAFGEGQLAICAWHGGGQMCCLIAVIEQIAVDDFLNGYVPQKVDEVAGRAFIFVRALQ